jgi:Sortase domain
MISGVAFGASAFLGLSGTYGFVPGIAATTVKIAAVKPPPVGRPNYDKTSSTTTQAFDLKPAFVEIDRVAVTSSLIPLGLRDDGTLQVPTVASQAGWFAEGVVPGQAGPAVLVGHVDSYLGAAVFARLKELKPDDRIRVVMNDGSMVVFAVSRVDQYWSTATRPDRRFVS